MRSLSPTIAFAIAAGMVSVAQADVPYGLSINGVCDVGFCPPTTAQAPGGGSSITGSESAELPNGDLFRLSGSTVGTSSQATGIETYGSFTVTYVGNANSPTATVSQADTLNVIEYYLFATPVGLYPANYTAYEQTTGSFIGAVASGSSLANSYTSNGTTVGTYGPYIAPSWIDGPLTLFNVANIGTWTITDSVAVSFAAGSAEQSQIVFDASFGASAVPLPGTFWLMLAGLGGLALSPRKRTA